MYPLLAQLNSLSPFQCQMGRVKESLDMFRHLSWFKSPTEGVGIVLRREAL